MSTRAFWVITRASHHMEAPDTWLVLAHALGDAWRKSNLLHSNVFPTREGTPAKLIPISHL
jgi:hypothetical protein